MKTILIILIFYFACNAVYSQGYNHTWLLGYGIRPPTDTNTTYSKARLLFDAINDTVIGEERKMAFFETQATISDANGNLIAASNGCWIMDATGDTMLNGSGINPGLFTQGYMQPTTGLVLPHGSIMLPFPGDSSKIVMFHQTGNYDANLSSTELYYSVIDKTLNGGLGGVITNKKNVIAFSDTIGWGIAACKHANGRDWWIIATQDRTNLIFKVLFTPNGVFSVTTQTFNFPIPFYGNAGEPCFSPDGSKFAYTYGELGANIHQDVRIFSFDRCSGLLDSIGYIYKSNQVGLGLSFSPNSKYLYYSSFGKVFQLNTDTIDIAASDTLVATYDGYWYPYPSLNTDFYLMYLSASGKIYISSSNFVLDLNVINSPDSAGIACDMQQHSLHLPCYSGYGNVYHPNYYLGRLQGSPCDTLQWQGIKEPVNDFRFRVYPNPVTNSSLSIGYLLPQNKPGVFMIYDITGKVVFKYNLPQWSNEQALKLPQLANGIYNATIISNNQRVSKTIAIINE